ncbi:TPA: hypothetical protein ACX6RY_000232 [Photobacterium damselae]
MNREEELAQRYLKKILPAKPLIFEPDGNIPPDFLLNNSVAIEVTRLNEHIDINGFLKRLDDDSSSIIEFIKQILATYKSVINDTCFFVVAYIQRPFGNRKKNKKKLIDLLNTFQCSGDVNCYQKYKITNGLSLRFTKASFDEYTSAFRLGSISEHEKGGWVFDNMVVNTTHCINIKSTKILPYRENYDEWWLVLIDTIAYGCYSEYIEDFKLVIKKGLFDKVIILEAEKGNCIFEF